MAHGDMTELSCKYTYYRYMPARKKELDGGTDSELKKEGDEAYDR